MRTNSTCIHACNISLLGVSVEDFCFRRVDPLGSLYDLNRLQIERG
jgi:hypothetical protein